MTRARFPLISILSLLLGTSALARADDIVPHPTLAWNVLDMPRTLTSGSVSTQRSYLADGTLAQVYDGSTTRLYVGDMVFSRSGTSGTPVLESAAWEGPKAPTGVHSECVEWRFAGDLSGD